MLQTDKILQNLAYYYLILPYSDAMHMLLKPC